MSLPDVKPLDIVADGIPFVRVDLTGLSDNLDIVADGILWLGYQAAVAGSATAYPGTVVDDASVGVQAWSNPGNASADDGSNAVSTIGLSYTETGYGAQLIVGDSPTGDKKTSTLDTTLRAGEYGGAADLWGCTLTPSIVNASNFGVGYQSVGMGGISHRLKATNFGFNIPAGSRIDGVLVTIERQITGSGPYYNNIDYVKMQVYYTEGAGTSSIAIAAAAYYRRLRS